MSGAPAKMPASIALPGDHGELPRLQAFAGEFARDCGLPEDERARLLIILEELFTNVVAHGQRADAATSSVIARLRLKDGWLIIYFVDDGRPFDPLAFGRPNLDAPWEERPIGGLGVHIVRSLVDRARYRRAGQRNHLHLARRIRLISAASD
jgi:serine/threonine-protein kinase RsbW